MRKIKISLFFIFTVIFTPKAFSQGVMFVEDITAIATAIENGLTMYNDLMTTIEQFQKTCEQLENMKKQMESFDLSKYDWKKWDTFLHAANDFMDMQDNLEALIDAKNMKIGGVSFSLRDLYTTDLWISLLDESEKKLDPRNISEEDQKRFVSRHGMTVDHYMKFINLEKEIATKSQEIVVVTEQADAATKKISQQLEDIPVESDSEKSAYDIQNQRLKAQNDIAIIEAKKTSLLLQSVQNIGQHILDEHDLERENFEASTRALEKHDAVVNGAYRAADDNDYIHIWGRGKTNK